MKEPMKILISCVVIVAVFVIAKVSVSAAKSTQYKLVWSDEFNEEKLDTTIWNYDLGAGGWGNNEREYYTDDEKNVRLENGNLVITARAEKDENGKFLKYTSGRINTSGKASFKYGKLEARIKVPNDMGLWPAFWMLGQNNSRGWPYCGELDILETWNDLNFAQGTIHWENEKEKPNRDSYDAGSTKMADKTQWHVYGMIWNPKTIEFTLDNKIYKTVSISSSDKSELRKEFYFLINCAVGGNLPYYSPNEEFESAEMLVDYVRVYQRECDNPSATFEKNYKDEVPTVTAIFKNLGKKVSKQTVQCGETFKLPTVKRKKYKFVGWYNAKTNKKINEIAGVSEDTTFNAKWKKIDLKQAKITSTKQKYKKSVSLKYTAKGSYDGFQVQIGKKKETTKYKSIIQPGFKSGKTYKVKVRTYAIDSTGKKNYGKWSKTVDIKVK